MENKEWAAHRARQHSVDLPAEVLYWTLTQGQRQRLAEQLGLLDAKDRRQADDLARSQAWLKRARLRGSFDKVILLADQLHRADLRQIEDTVRRFGYRRDSYKADYSREDALMSELEEYRSRHYSWLQYGRSIVAEDRRARAFDQANQRWPQPLAS
jgi:hypothetical protein